MLAFFDTNILVYLFDQDSPAKQKTARDLFQREVEAGRFVTSTQVLQEFFVTVTRKLAVPLPAVAAEEAVRALAELTIAPVDVPLVLGAIGRSRDMQISFWDALVVEAALSAGATTLLTEDLQAGRQIGTLTIENPFVGISG
jgi:predicted nucleic acid-binding protein